jgi:hypothetical protein
MLGPENKRWLNTSAERRLNVGGRMNADSAGFMADSAAVYANSADFAELAERN